jgi:putative ABC transport system permease protein
MIRHVFRLMWNRKRRNFLLTVEIFFSFLVLFAVATMAISHFINYLKPLGFAYDNVWMVHLDIRSEFGDSGRAGIRETLGQLEREMRSCNEVENVSWAAGNIPYTGSTWATSLDWEGMKGDFDISLADDNFASVMNIPILEGRWFSREDDASAMTPVVITRKMRELIGEDRPVVGMTHTEKDDEYVVVGVVPEYRHLGEFQGSMNRQGSYFQRSVIHDTTSQIPEVALISVKSGTGIQFEETLTKRLSAIARDWNVRIETLADKRSAYIKDNLAGIGMFGIVAGFLVFNVALGLYGVLWYSISLRRGEVGLRRAVGADTGKISRQILSEALVMTTFALAVGIFFAAQTPILGFGLRIDSAVYLFAMVCAAMFIYILVTSCALYPSWLAARIDPATALHEE